MNVIKKDISKEQVEALLVGITMYLNLFSYIFLKLLELHSHGKILTSFDEDCLKIDNIVGRPLNEWPKDKFDDFMKVRNLITPQQEVNLGLEMQFFMIYIFTNHASKYVDRNIVLDNIIGFYEGNIDRPTGLLSADAYNKYQNSENGLIELNKNLGEIIDEYKNVFLSMQFHIYFVPIDIHLIKPAIDKIFIK